MPVQETAEAGHLEKFFSGAGRRIAFVKEFIKAPGEMAAVSPSSRRLARQMIEGLDFSTARVVVEYGPGLGTFTDAIVSEIEQAAANSTAGQDACRLIAIERNERMAELLRERHPGVTLHHDDAANVRQICRDEGFESVDYVVSGLGWPSFSDDLRTRILEATADVLRPGGEFRTFGYHVGLMMKGAWHFRRTVRRLFSDVTISKVVWANMPPAFVYKCVK
jgi:phosphatidylethanolamine/phosphatidyl-N-methylethanolamine N-methyltransferase